MEEIEKIRGKATELKNKLFEAYGVRIKEDDPSLQFLFLMFEYAGELEIEKFKLIVDQIEAASKGGEIRVNNHVESMRTVNKELLKANLEEIKNLLNKYEQKLVLDSETRRDRALKGLVAVSVTACLACLIFVIALIWALHAC